MIHGHLIGAEAIHGDPTFDSLDPSRGDAVLAGFPLGREADVDRAIDAARAAQPAWERAGAIARGAVLRRAAALTEARADELARDIAREVGKPITEARAEVARAAVTLYYVAEQARLPVGEVLDSDDPAMTVLAVRRPLGVVAAITPWNFPFGLPVWKLAPALLHGNAVVWKPAEHASLVALRLAEVLREAGLPAGVLDVVFGDGETGAALACSDALAAISFTGSTPVGRRLAEVAAKTGARLQTELGGKNPLVVLADADVDLAADLVVTGGTSYAGQKCSATSRVIVVPEVADALVEAVRARIAALRIGDPLDEHVQVGPLIDEAALRRSIDAARAADGARLIIGGERLERDGWFMRPALLDGVDARSALAQREVFGPVIAIQRAADRDHAIELANDSEFGFFVGVCTRDLGVVTELAPRLRFGMVRVNAVTTGADPHVPFGGWKASGNLAPEQGLAAREFYTRVQSIYLK
jgi:alpha-ketoglutaric semialdehyde dehydrogenase